MGCHGHQVAWNHQGILLPVRLVGRDAAVLRRGEIDVVGADVVPNLLRVARRPVAVEVTEVTVDFIHVPLLRTEVRGGREEEDKDNRKRNGGRKIKKKIC